MSEVWDLGRALGLPLLCGLALVRLCGLPRDLVLLRLGLAWLCGSLGTALLLFTWLAVGLPLAGAVALDLVLAALAVAVPVLHRRGAADRAPLRQTLGPLPAARTARGLETWTWRLCLALALALALWRIVDGSRLALIVGDGAEHWAGKARHVFGAGGFGAGLAKAAHEPGALTQLDYPLLNPMLQLWVFVHEGGIVHSANKLPIALASLALCCVLAGTLPLLLRPILAGPLLLVAVTPGAAAAWAVDGASDGLVAFGLVALLAVWLLRDRLGPRATPPLLAAAIAFAIWSKNEGLMFALAILIAVPTTRVCAGRGLPLPRDRRPLWLLLPAGVLVLQLGFNLAHDFASTFAKHERGDLLSLLFSQAGERLLPTLAWFGRRVLADPAHSSLLFTVFLVLLLAFPRANLSDPDLAAPAVALLLALAGLLAVFVASPGEFRWQLATAADRVLFQCQPCAVLLSAALVRARLGWVRPSLRPGPTIVPG